MTLKWLLGGVNKIESCELKLQTRTHAWSNEKDGTNAIMSTNSTNTNMGMNTNMGTNSKNTTMGTSRTNEKMNTRTNSPSKNMSQ